MFFQSQMLRKAAPVSSLQSCRCTYMVFSLLYGSKNRGGLLPWGEGKEPGIRSLFCVIAYNQFNGHTNNNDCHKQNKAG